MKHKIQVNLYSDGDVKMFMSICKKCAKYHGCNPYKVKVSEAFHEVSEIKI